MSVYLVFSAEYWQKKSPGLGAPKQMFPCTEVPPKVWQKKAMMFDIPGPRKTQQGHIHQNCPLQNPFCFPSIMVLKLKRLGTTYNWKAKLPSGNLHKIFFPNKFLGKSWNCQFLHRGTKYQPDCFSDGCFLNSPRVMVADCVNSSPPLISRKFRGFGGIWVRGNSGKFWKIQWNSVWRLI